ncbi:MAG: hypothetical protein GY875_23415 [Gammaproteobacteria bacterium]|nr:hypothetical protein [Gammaproteobacteria bacterium]
MSSEEVFEISKNNTKKQSPGSLSRIISMQQIGRNNYRERATQNDGG